MTNKTIHIILTYFIAGVWLINGICCKVLNLTPRHQQIVGRILGEDYSGSFTFIIGMLEIGMAVWIMIRIKSRLNAITQICIIAIMNILEFILVPDLLLWGKFNILFAALFIALIYYNEFIINNRSLHKTI
jgi:hypothetical protein